MPRVILRARSLRAANKAPRTVQTYLDGLGHFERFLAERGMPRDVDWVRLCRTSKPLVAAVNGAAVGIGMTMILPFDVIVASEKAKLGMFFIKVGLVPELASTHFLVQRAGFGKASEMCLSGKLYSAGEAAEMGIGEDPATGGAAGPLGAYLAEHGLAGGPGRVTIRQGEQVGRPSELHAEAAREGSTWRVRVGGGVLRAAHTAALAARRRSLT